MVDGGDVEQYAPRSIALRRQGIMPPKRPAAGGESRSRASFSFFMETLAGQPSANTFFIV